MYKNILVTGGSGLVGSSLKNIQAKFPGVRFTFLSSKDCNLTILDAAVDLVKTKSPDAIMHLAAVSGGIGLSMKYPATLLRDNVLMDINILEAARLNKVSKVVMSLSTGMYPADCPNPIKEEYIHNGYPHASNYSYAFAKRLVDPLVKAYRNEYGMNVIGLIPNGIFGEYSNFSYESSTMLPALIRRFYENKDNHEKIIIWGDGSPWRELTYGADMARTYMWCLQNYNDEPLLHIGTTEEHTVKEIAYLIAKVMGIDINRISFDISKPAGQFRKNTDNSRFIKISNFKYTPFREGLEKTVKWFCDHYHDKNKLRL